MQANRGKVDVNQMKYRYEDALKNYAESINGMDSNPLLINSLWAEAYELFFTACLFEKDKQKIARYLLHYVESSLAVFNMADNIGKTISFEVAGTVLELTVPDTSFDISIIKWINVFYAASLLQKHDLLKAITGIDLNVVQQKMNSVSEKYNLQYSIFLQNYYSKNGDASEYLLNASIACSEVSTKSMLYDYMLEIGSPQIDIFSNILYKKEKMLTDNFEVALKYFKKHYSGSASKGINDFTGIVSLPLSALAGIAQREGLAIEVTSDFIIESFV